MSEQDDNRGCETCRHDGEDFGQGTRCGECLVARFNRREGLIHWEPAANQNREK
jgi:hypothetical protein